MILVTTAGKVGSAAARRIAERRLPVRLLARHPERALDLARAGVEVFSGDLARPDDVEAALRGVSTVLLVTPPIVEHELRVIESAKRAGVEHVVKITSKASGDSPIGRRRDQREIESALVASGLNFTLLRNNAYMQNFLMMAKEIATTGNFCMATGDGRIGHIDVRDVADVAAHIAAAPAGHAGKTYWPTGPESLSGKDVAEVLTKVLGRSVSFYPISFKEQKQAMVDLGLPERAAEDNARAVAMMGEGDCDYVTDDVPRLLGRSARSFERFAIDHAEAFS